MTRRAPGAPRHRFLVPAEQWSVGCVSFSPEQSRQLSHVLRLAAGDLVSVFNGVDTVDSVVELTAVGSTAAGTVQGAAPQAREPRIGIVVYASLLQRDKFEVVLQKLVETGASSIVPLLTERSLARRPPSDDQRRRWQSILREAAEQSGRGMMPDLGPAVHFQEALRSALTTGPALLADPSSASEPLRRTLEGLKPHASDLKHISLFTGPEGGFAPSEVQVARELGAMVVSLGPRVLRSETAAPIFTALVLYELDA